MTADGVWCNADFQSQFVREFLWNVRFRIPEHYAVGYSIRNEVVQRGTIVEGLTKAGLGRGRRGQTPNLRLGSTGRPQGVGDVRARQTYAGHVDDQRDRQT